MPDAASPCLDDDLRAFLLGPISVFLGTADTMGTADATRIGGMAAIDATHLRVLIDTGARAARANAVVGAAASVIATDITTYRSIQWKGRIAEVPAERTAGDLALAHRHEEAFTASCAQVGIDPDRAWRIFPDDLVPVVVEVCELFDQSPGPGAGRKLDLAGGGRPERGAA